MEVPACRLLVPFTAIEHAAVEHTVTRKRETAGYRALVAESMQDMAFEVVVRRHPEALSADAVERAEQTAG